MSIIHVAAHRVGDIHKPSVSAVVGTQDPQPTLMVLIGVLAAIVAIAVPIVIPVVVFAALPTIVGIEFQRAIAALGIFILFGFAVPPLYTNDQVLILMRSGINP